jgi:hypothetical protein
LALLALKATTGLPEHRGLQAQPVHKAYKEMLDLLEQPDPRVQLVHRVFKVLLVRRAILVLLVRRAISVILVQLALPELPDQQAQQVQPEHKASRVFKV